MRCAAHDAAAASALVAAAAAAAAYCLAATRFFCATRAIILPPHKHAAMVLARSDFVLVQLASAFMVYNGAAMQEVAILQVVFWISRLLLLLVADADLSTYTSSINETYFLDKVVWVTGASSGIGECLAYELSRMGAIVVLSARRRDELERVRSACGGKNKDKHAVLPLDVLDCIKPAASGSDAAAAVAARALKLHGRIDILVNNAGRSQRALAEATPWSVDREIMELNYTATVALTKAVLPHMIKAKAGHIVNTNSVAGKMGSPCSSGYAASKHALQGFMDSLRMEVYDSNIVITNICPGPVQSNITAAAFTHTPGKSMGSLEAQTADKHRMATRRCCIHMLKAMSNQLAESWISKHPVLLFAYMNNYLPTLTKIVAAKIGNKKVGKRASTHPTPYTSHLTPRTSHLTPHTSHLTPHTSHLTPHTSHLTPHTSHATGSRVQSR
jgi:dehydrogenase/reductase SDR family protein 7